MSAGVHTCVEDGEAIPASAKASNRPNELSRPVASQALGAVALLSSASASASVSVCSSPAVCKQRVGSTESGTAPACRTPNCTHPNSRCTRQLPAYRRSGSMGEQESIKSVPHVSVKSLLSAPRAIRRCPWLPLPGPWPCPRRRCASQHPVSVRAQPCRAVARRRRARCRRYGVCSLPPPACATPAESSPCRRCAAECVAAVRCCGVSVQL